MSPGDLRPPFPAARRPSSPLLSRGDFLEFIDINPSLRLHESMSFEVLVRKLGKMTVTVALVATPVDRSGTVPDPTQSGIRSEGLTITATYQGWTPEMVHKLAPYISRNPRASAGDLMLAMIIEARSKLSGHLEGAALTATTGQKLVKADEPVDMILRLEATVSWQTIESMERHVIDYLAYLFDGRAQLKLQENRDQQSSDIVLSVGDMALENPIFDTRNPVDLLICDDGRSNVELLRFNTTAPELLSILSAGPAVLRSTPGGRRELAMLFLEGAIEAALELHDTPDDFDIEDFTPSPQKRMLVKLRGLPTSEIVRFVVDELCERWPNIFA